MPTARVPSTQESLSARGRLAAAVRDHGPDHPATQQARLAFEVERYLAAVRAAVADAPPLTADQCARLRQILVTAPTTANQAEAAA